VRVVWLWKRDRRLQKSRGGKGKHWVKTAAIPKLNTKECVSQAAAVTHTLRTLDNKVGGCRVHKLVHSDDAGRAAGVRGEHSIRGV